MRRPDTGTPRKENNMEEYIGYDAEFYDAYVDMEEDVPSPHEFEPHTVKIV